MTLANIFLPDVKERA